MAFVMVISNLKSSRWFKIYSRKTLEKRVKKAVFFADFEGKSYYNPKKNGRSLSKVFFRPS